MSQIGTIFSKLFLAGRDSAMRQFAANTFWAGLGEVASKGLTFVALICVSRELGAYAFGKFGILRSTLATFVMFGSMGLGLTATRYVAEHRKSDTRRCGEIIAFTYALALVCGVVAGCVAFAAAEYVAFYWLKAPDLGVGIRIMAIILVFHVFNGAQIGVLQGLDGYRGLAFANLIYGVALFFSVVGGAILGGATGAVAGMGLASLIATVCYRNAIKRRESELGIISPRFPSYAQARIFWSFSVPAAITGILIGPFKWMAEVLLSRDGGFQQLGIFTAAASIMTALSGVGTVLNAPILTMTSGAGPSGESSRRAQYLNLYGAWYLAFAIGIPIVLFSSEVAQIFGGDFASRHGASCLALLVLYAGLSLYYQGFVRIIAIKSSLWLAVATNVFEGLALVICFLTMESRDATSLGIAYVVSYLVRIVVSVPIVLRFRLLSPRLIFDPYFFTSLAVLSAAVLWQLWRH